METSTPGEWAAVALISFPCIKYICYKNILNLGLAIKTKLFTVNLKNYKNMFLLRKSLCRIVLWVTHFVSPFWVKSSLEYFVVHFYQVFSIINLSELTYWVDRANNYNNNNNDLSFDQKKNIMETYQASLK